MTDTEHLTAEDHALCEKLGCFSNGSPWEEELARDAQTRIRELSAKLNDHPNAEDYRNRAERAEQALAEMAGWDGLSLAVALTQCQAKLAAAESDADKLAEAAGVFRERYIKMIDSGDCGFWNPREEPEVVAVTTALAAHAARKIDG